MAIIQKVDSYLFCEAFKQVRPDNFSYEGLELLFEYLDNLSDDTGQDIELDVIAICCDIAEYTLAEWFTEYANQEEVELMDEDEAQEVMLAEIVDNPPDNIIAHNDDYSVIIVDSNY